MLDDDNLGMVWGVFNYRSLCVCDWTGESLTPGLAYHIRVEVTNNTSTNKSGSIIKLTYQTTKKQYLVVSVELIIQVVVECLVCQSCVVVCNAVDLIPQNV